MSYDFSLAAINKRSNGRDKSSRTAPKSNRENDLMTLEFHHDSANTGTKRRRKRPSVAGAAFSAPVLREMYDALPEASNWLLAHGVSWLILQSRYRQATARRRAA